MKRNSAGAQPALIALTGILLLNGCALQRPDLIKNGTVLYEPNNKEKIHVCLITSETEGRSLSLTGHVYKEAEPAGDADKNGHIDIIILGPEKQILSKTRAEIISKEKIQDLVHEKHKHSYRNFHNGNSGIQLNFKASAPVIPPQGSVIKIAWHAAPDASDCLQNRPVSRTVL